MSNQILTINNLKKTYPIYGNLGKLFPPKTHMHAVSNVSFNIYEGETYGLVGESGCGKSTTGRSILGLVKPDAGEIIYKDKDLTKLNDKQFHPFRKDIQLVFQDSLSSMNPRQRIKQILEDPLIIHKIGDAKDRHDIIMDMLIKVGLSTEHYFRYSHELSGGQVQRLGIARALIIEPKLLVCDEAVSALDVSVQAQILNMLNQIQSNMHLSMLFISHDIGVVRYISSRIGVMYLGTLVEEAETDELFNNTLHPYTKALFDSVPETAVKNKHRTRLTGELPVHTDEFTGCVLHTRCPYATDKCKTISPTLQEITPGHRVACHKI